MTSADVQILIAGAGGAGLSLALVLLQQGIRPLLVERRDDVPWHPGAHSLNFRSMEVLRGLGLSAAVHAAGGHVGRMFARDQLASGEQRESLDPGSLLNVEALSPEPFVWHCPQSRLGPVLLAAARARGAEIREATELLDFTQDEHGVTATLHDRSRRAVERVRAAFLVGADGEHSRVREILRIPTQGAGTLDAHAIGPWQPDQGIADRFQDGRVLLVGDAAHTMPPEEGLGVNTAIHSAQNLGWKLAAVLTGAAAPALLSTYEIERYPVAWFAAQYSTTGAGAALLARTAVPGKASPFFPIVGYRYRSDAILSEDGSESSREIALLDREALTGVPGSRVPHLWLARNGQRLSTLDLLDGRFVLLTGEGTWWRDEARRAARLFGLALAAYRIGRRGDLADPAGDWPRRLGVPGDGAMLLRPDGVVAWRSRAGSMPLELHLVLSRILQRAIPGTTMRKRETRAGKAV
jgi:2-polyprenyl-6-methoxyphenol hydroxylase-like FAD-dependent oxidoreductase